MSELSTARELFNSEAALTSLGSFPAESPSQNAPSYKRSLTRARRNWKAVCQEFALMEAARPDSVERALAAYARVRSHLISRFELGGLAEATDCITRQIIQQRLNSDQAHDRESGDAFWGALKVEIYDAVGRVRPLVKARFSRSALAPENLEDPRITFNPLVNEVFTRVALLDYLRSIN